MKEHFSINLNEALSSSTIHFSFGALKERRGVVLAGDIGGTKANISVFELQNGILSPIFEKTFATKKFSSFGELYNKLKAEQLPNIDSICLGVAGPVIDGKVSGTNFSWELDAMQIKKELGIKEVTLINDLEANAYGLAVLKEKDLLNIKKGGRDNGNCAIISPGTGLGEAGLYWDGKEYHPFATEGGHCDFSAKTDFDISLLKFLRERYGIVSWEKILSGSGIVDLYRFLLHHHAIEEPGWFKERLEREDPAALISSCAKENSYGTCNDAMDLFFKYLATEAAQVALKFKATGGIFIGGGIPPKNLELVNKKKFTAHFLEMDRMRPLLENIPINIILNQNSPKYGTALVAGMHLPKII